MTGTQAVGNLIKGCIKQGFCNLNEDRAKDLFRLAGMPVVDEIRAESPAEALRAGQKIGFPLVVKGLAAGMLHKSDAGLVATGIRDEAGLGAAVEGIANRAGKALEAFVVQPMIQGRREFVAGMFRDAQFGPVIMFGLGGVLTEAIGDIVFRIAPLSQRDMEEMLDGLNAETLMGPFRGEAAPDRAALRQVLQGLSDLATTFPEIREVDINPLIVRPEGTPVAVDGLVVLGDTSEKETAYSPIDFQALNTCFYPESIAFVGASATPGKWGHMLPVNTFARDFKGRVYLVNPKGGEIMGRKAYTRLSEIEDNVDLAVVTVPAARVMDLIPEMQAKGVKGMLLITSGFREVGPEGAALEEALVEKARQAGILLLGPNTMGICNPHARFFCTAANAFPLPGSTALVCQSGNLGTQLLGFAQQQGIGIRAFSGSGNEAMVTIEDYLEAFEQDDLTRAVVLYIESIKNGRRFLASAARVSMKKTRGGAQGGTHPDRGTGRRQPYRGHGLGCRRVQGGLRPGRDHSGGAAHGAFRPVRRVLLPAPARGEPGGHHDPWRRLGGW